MYCYDLEVTSSNPSWVELWMHSTTVLSRIEPKISVIPIKSYETTGFVAESSCTSFMKTYSFEEHDSFFYLTIVLPSRLAISVLSPARKTVVLLQVTAEAMYIL